jgi:3-dehydrosphinganine reductase
MRERYSCCEVKIVQFRGAHVVITGGSSGIGLATAGLVARRGSSVSLMARDTYRLERAAEQVRALGAAVRTATADVSDPVAVARAFAGLADEAGPCDVLITSAGQARPGRFLELDDEVFRHMIDVDYFGTLYAVRAVAPEMVRRRTGSIVAISSAAALFGIYGYSAYAPAKFAVRGLMESLRDELRPHGVHIGCVYPPDVDTPQLAEENRWKPTETTAISGTIKPMTPERVAETIVRGIERERFAIYPNRSTAMLAGFGPPAAPVLRWMIDRKVRAARPSTSTST